MAQCKIKLGYFQKLTTVNIITLILYLLYGKEYGTNELFKN
jgi:hypothetical protein